MNRQSGQSSVEFLLVAGALGVALFYPFVDGQSVGDLLLKALVASLRARSYILSIL